MHDGVSPRFPGYRRTFLPKAVLILGKRAADERSLLCVVLGAVLVLRSVILLNIASIEIDGVHCPAAHASALYGSIRERLLPHYPIAVASLHLLVPDVELAGLLVSLACGVLVIYLCLFFAKRFYEDRRTAVSAADTIAVLSSNYAT